MRKFSAVSKIGSMVPTALRHDAQPELQIVDIESEGVCVSAAASSAHSALKKRRKSPRFQMAAGSAEDSGVRPKTARARAVGNPPPQGQTMSTPPQIVEAFGYMSRITAAADELKGQSVLGRWTATCFS